MKYFFIIAATTIYVWLWVDFVGIIIARGGWAAYQATNPFAGAAGVYMFCWTIMYAVGMFVAGMVIYEDMQDKRKRMSKK